jgi:hypothetical protein
MPEFLAETYAPATHPAPAVSRAGNLSVAAGRACRLGVSVRFAGAIVVPDDETCFCLYQAPSAAAVCEAMTRARLQLERITQAMSIIGRR